MEGKIINIKTTTFVKEKGLCCEDVKLSKILILNRSTSIDIDRPVRKVAFIPKAIF